MLRAALASLALAACAGRAPAPGPAAPLRPCNDACVTRAPDAAVAANDARVQEDPAAALAAAERVRGPLDRASHARLWRQRGMAHALLAYAAAAEAKDDPASADARKQEQAAHEAAARAAFDMLLALDPMHRLEYTQSPQTTFVFQAAIADAAARPQPALDVDWERDLRVGDPIPVDVEVIADPKQFLARASLFVRRRGETAWRAADLALPAPGAYRRLVLPAELSSGVRTTTSVELFLRAYDADGNEVLAWASPERPREVPLRWDPPAPWWRKWWVWAIGAGAVAGVTGIAVYAAQWEPSDRLDGDVTIE